MTFMTTSATPHPKRNGKAAWNMLRRSVLAAVAMNWSVFEENQDGAGKLPGPIPLFMCLRWFYQKLG